MAEKRRGLGRGLGALIPSGPSGTDRPVDVFFPGTTATQTTATQTTAPPPEQGPGSRETSVGPLEDPRPETVPEPGAQAAPDGPAGSLPHQSTDSGIDRTTDARARGALLRTDGAVAGTGGDGTPTPDAGEEHAGQTAEAPRAGDGAVSLLPVPGAHLAWAGCPCRAEQI